MGDVEEIVHTLVQEQDDQLAQFGLLPDDLFGPNDSANLSLDLSSALANRPYESSAANGNRLTSCISSHPSGNISKDTEQTVQGLSQLTANERQAVSAERYINAYYLNYRPAHPFIHEMTFRDTYATHGLSAHSLTWSILVNAVIAIGSWCLKETNSEIDMEYYLRAKELLEQVSLMEPGNLSLIQGLLLLHDFSQKRGMPETGLHYLSAASRMAINIGLHKEDPNHTTTPFESEMRRWVWWSIYIYDSCAAKNFGVPILLPENKFITTKSVLNIHDEAFDPLAASVPSEINGVTIYSGLIFQAKFHLTANNIYRRLISTPNISIPEVQEMEKLIDAWHDSLPPYLKQPNSPADSETMNITKDRLRICDKNLRILLWKPFLFKRPLNESSGHHFIDSKNDLHKECAFRCLFTAKESMSLVLQSIRRRQPNRPVASFLLYAP
ncbi:Regulatory protein GAL4 [Talaromyces islandicus]|uniref:Regulatory protein GAL4 n=1 Tax=Talaromyces islandicus TaxID=28573 RepID=A0A0U1M4S9_TALIS|nr:Regulatory protein GAL4 [Talaromyces islandicus]